jgi:hypothetical protein
VLKQPLANQLLPELNSHALIDLQEGDGNPANRRAADQIRALPAEMRRPVVAAGIEQRGELACLPVQARNIRPL